MLKTNVERRAGFDYTVPYILGYSSMIHIPGCPGHLPSSIIANRVGTDAVRDSIAWIRMRSSTTASLLSFAGEEIRKLAKLVSGSKEDVLRTLKC